MAPTKCGRGRGSKGLAPRAAKRPNPMEGRRGCKPAKHLIVDAVATYTDETDEGT